MCINDTSINLIFLKAPVSEKSFISVCCGLIREVIFYITNLNFLFLFSFVEYLQTHISPFVEVVEIYSRVNLSFRRKLSTHWMGLDALIKKTGPYLTLKTPD